MAPTDSEIDFLHRSERSDAARPLQRAKRSCFKTCGAVIMTGRLPSVPVVADQWVAGVMQACGQRVQLTPKEFGQLKQLRNATGAETENVIAWVLANWARFSTRAAMDAGLTSVPPTPHVGFLLRHRAIAMKMLAALPPAQVRAKLTTFAAGSPAAPNADRVTEGLLHSAARLPGHTAEAPHQLTDEELERLIAELKA